MEVGVEEHLEERRKLGGGTVHFPWEDVYKVSIFRGRGIKKMKSMDWTAKPAKW